MAVMDHHDPLLPLYSGEQILKTIHIQYLQVKLTDNYLYRTFIK